jgi:hypothetical protein
MTATAPKFRCRACRRPWDDVRHAPMVHDPLWAALGCKPHLLLCYGCFRARMRRCLGREPRFEDLTACPFNIMEGYHLELAQPGEQRINYEAAVYDRFREQDEKLKAAIARAADAEVRS